MNRRARTHAVVRDNRIFGIYVSVNGIPVKSVAYYHNRKMVGGRRYTGPFEGAWA